VTLYSFFFGFFMVLPFAYSEFSEVQFSILPDYIWGVLAFVTIGSTFLTYVLNAYALRHADSGLVGSYIYLQPVMAAIIAISSGKDTLSMDKILSMLLISFGVYLASQTRFLNSSIVKKSV
jgi:drug/metabolite transporter (DMT)-like permease